MTEVSTQEPSTQEPSAQGPSTQELRELLKLDYNPTAQQTQIITYPLIRDGNPQPLLVVAGAGSGKTETMSVRGAYLTATGQVEPEQILGLTFTRKAAAELAQKLIAKGGRAGDGLQFGSEPVATTYNAFALSVVQEFGPLVGVPPETIHMDQAAAWQLMFEIVASWTGDLPESAPTTVVDAALGLRESMAGQGMTVEQARHALTELQGRFDLTEATAKKFPKFLLDGSRVNRERILLLDVVAQFEEEKRAQQRTDFADQVVLATQIVQRSDHARRVLRDRHRAVFLDEFQDTSVSQMEFLSSLFAEHPVTAVGDPNQAIYGWRGASAAALEDFHRLFSPGKQAEAAVLHLSVSWRNSRRILQAANTIAEPLRTGTGSLHSPKVPSPKLEPSSSAAKGDIFVSFSQFQDQQVKAVVQFVAESLANLQTENPSVAVLCRRVAFMEPILRALREADIPAEIAGAQGLLFQSAAVDLRAALRAANDPGDSPALVRLLTRLEIGTRDLWELGRLAAQAASGKDQRPGSAGGAQSSGNKPTSGAQGSAPMTVPLLADAIALAENSEMSPAAIRRVTRLNQQLRSLRSAASWPISEQVGYARRLLELDHQAAVIGEERQVAEILDTMEAIAAEYQSSAPFPTMEGFLSWLDAAEDKERGLQLPTVQPDPNAVQILTVHAAKGLEWDAVAVVDLELPVFPSKRGGAGVRRSETGVEAPLNGSGVQPQKGWWQKLDQLPYPARRDSEHLPSPNVWQLVEEGETAKYVQEVFEDEVGQYLQQEERRLAYVAVTRPRFRLGLFGAWVGNGSRLRFPSMFLTEIQEALAIEGDMQPPPDEEEVKANAGRKEAAIFPAPAGHVRKALREGAAVVRAELARANVDPDVALAQLPKPMRSDLRALLAEGAESERRAHLTAEERAAEDLAGVIGDEIRVQTTGLADIASSSTIWSDLRRPAPQQPFAEAALGSAFHLWAERRLKTVAAGKRTEEPEEFVPPALLPSQRSELVALQRNFEALGWIGRATPLALEVPFSFQMPGALIRGRMDAVLQIEGESTEWVIDWKTGRKGRLGEDLDKLESYLVQLSTYRAAWKARSGRTPQAKLVFLRGDQPVEVQLEELEALYLQATGTQWSLEGLASRAVARLHLDAPQ